MIQKVHKTEQLSCLIKQKCSLSHLKIILNTFTEDINVELFQKEATKPVLDNIKNLLKVTFEADFEITQSPILSGYSSNYMDNPINNNVKALYLFEKVN